MSDLLIKGMDLPTDDIVSLIAVFSGGDVKFIDRTTFSTFYIPQKAIEVPSHGRLIDADALRGEINHLICTDCEMGTCEDCNVDWCDNIIENAPTVLEATE